METSKTQENSENPENPDNQEFLEEQDSSLQTQPTNFASKEANQADEASIFLTVKFTSLFLTLCVGFFDSEFYVSTLLILTLALIDVSLTTGYYANIFAGIKIWSSQDVLIKFQSKDITNQELTEEQKRNYNIFWKAIKLACYFSIGITIILSTIKGFKWLIPGTIISVFHYAIYVSFNKYAQDCPL